MSGCRPEEFQVAGGGDTRPVLTEFPPSAGGITVGITHSGVWVGAAAGRGLHELGIDIQEVAPRPVERMASFMNWMHALPSPAGTEAPDTDKFTHLWTLWEAAVKCDGTKLFAQTTPAFERLLAGCIPGTERYWSSEGYWALSQRVAERHWLTLVAHGGGKSAPWVETLRMQAPPLVPSRI